MILLTFTLYLLFGPPSDPGHVTQREIATLADCEREAAYWTAALDKPLRVTVRYKCREE